MRLATKNRIRVPQAMMRFRAYRQRLLVVYYLRELQDQRVVRVPQLRLRLHHRQDSHLLCMAGARRTIGSLMLWML